MLCVSKRLYAFLSQLSTKSAKPEVLADLKFLGSLPSLTNNAFLRIITLNDTR